MSATTSRMDISTHERSAQQTVGVYRQPDPAPAITPDVDPFEAGLRQCARRWRKSVPRLTPSEKDFLYDLAREEARYPMPTVRKLCRIARRSRKPEDREAFAELIRAESTSVAPLCIEKAFDLETPAPGAADVAQRAFEQDPNPITWQRCRDALYLQFATTRYALDAVLMWAAAGPIT